MAAAPFSIDVAPVTPPPMCPDLDKNEICSSQCGIELNECKDNCYHADYSCPSRCDAAFLDCKYACPCEGGCPNGCSGCGNPVCQADEYLLILNEWKAFENIGYLVNLSTDEISFSSIDYHGIDIDDTCYAFMKGQHYIIGGYLRPHMILTLEVDKCELTEQGNLEIQHIDGMWGACAVYNDVAHLCFDEEGVDMFGCQTFDGTNQNVIDARTQYAHDWSSMAVYNNKMWVVGGCDSYSNGGCHNHVESFDGSSWSLSAAHPDSELVGHLVLGDANGLYTLSDIGEYLNRWAVQKFDGFTWTMIGELSESHAASYTINSGKIINGYAYMGENELDKVRLDENNYSATNLGYDPVGDDFWLYYSPMLLVDGPVCS